MTVVVVELLFVSMEITVNREVLANTRVSRVTAR